MNNQLLEDYLTFCCDRAAILKIFMLTKIRCSQFLLSVQATALLALSLAAFTQTVWRVGDRVEAGFMGSSYTYKTGVVIEAGKGQYKVHFDGYTADYDSWVPAERVKPGPAGSAPPAAVASLAAKAPDSSGNQMPPCQIGMIVRAGALNYDAKILAFDQVKGLYKVQFVTGFKGDIEFVPPSGLKTCSAPGIAPVAESWFVGVWQLFTGGGGAWQKNPVTSSWKVVGLDAAGAPPIRINGDGTYEWVIDHSQTISGRWRKAAPSELKYGYEKRGTTILLVKGESGKNWLVSRELVSTTDGRDRILIERVDLGLTYRGNRVGKTGR